MNTYLLLRHLHITCVVLSGAGFLIRLAWMASESPRLRQRLTRTLPHVIDSVLLGSALTMAVWSSQYPFSQGWLTAKLCGLLAYIGLGTMALKRGRTRTARLCYGALAVLAYGYIVGVALTRNPFWL
ncbi:SirB2 family protein [Azonexus sp.]|uniref:SirB2 family protein n=1 Tax=Azonexus sp. TaxID=1872668 RepID=UPI0035B1D9A9